MLRKIQVSAILVSFLLLGAFPVFLDENFAILSLLLILLAGVPHGAADHIIFRHSNLTFFGARTLSSFLLLYILFGVGFLLIWSLSPLRALLLFIAISIYHFGQEHFEDIAQKGWIKNWLSISWGIFVLCFPLCWHWADTIDYIQQITGVEISMVAQPIRTLLTQGMVLNLLLALGSAYFSKIIGALRLFKEVINIILLALTFISMPLLYGFALYFVFWHSFQAMQDQVHFLQGRFTGYSWKNYLKDITPFSVVTFGMTMAGASLLVLADVVPDPAYLFILIGIISLPHILLFDLFYNRMKSGQ